MSLNRLNQREAGDKSEERITTQSVEDSHQHIELRALESTLKREMMLAQLKGFRR